MTPVTTVRSRCSWPLAALIALAAPLEAQEGGAHRFDGGSFVAELPASIPRLNLVQSTGTAGLRVEVITGGSPRDVAVLIYHSWQPDAPEARRAFAAAANMTPREIAALLSDTSATTRRELLRGRRHGFQTSGWVFAEAESRELRADGRLTIRSPISHTESQPLLTGWADASVVMNPGIESWTVMYVAAARTPELDAAAARFLDAFRITGRPTALHATSPSVAADSEKPR